ncbi:sce7726 family protein [Halioxenophilus aromaticivorans]|uniref:Sce7726 family protein n=1 Tax=Halioxenophilus aromaticivorans TaxID=1306992 RepID=A0AAV3U830_9ALTE
MRSEIDQIASLFSASSINALLDGNFSQFSLAKQILGFSETDELKVIDIVKQSFEFLKKNYPYEYVYKCTLFKNIVLGVHSPNTTAMLSELKLGTSKVDAMIINGIATSYEIKSEFDNFDRLEKQLFDYTAYSDKVFVVCSSKNADPIKNKISNSFGLMVLNKRGSFSIMRDSKLFNPSYTADKATSLLTAPELRNISREINNNIDNVPNTQLVKKCNKLISTLPPSQIKQNVFEALKSRGLSKNKVVSRLPYQLSGRALSLKISQRKQDAFFEALSTPI